MVRVLSGISTLLLVFAFGCASEVDGGGSPSGGPTGTGSGGSGSSSSGTGSSGGTGGTGGSGGSSSSGGGSDGGTSSITNCDELKAELTKEQQAIQSCTADAECGQELKGTSCGCTRNLVARLGADTTRFYELLDLSQQLECDAGFVSTCDCPNANGFVCTNGVCNWNYVP